MLPALNFEEDEGGGLIFSTIFVAEFRDVEKSLSPENVRAHQGAVGRAVRALLQHVESGLQASTALDQIYIPMLEHAVKSKDHGNRRKIVCIFRWLFAKTNLVSLLAKSLASIAVTSQENHRVKLGWCVIVRELLEKEALLYLFPSDVQVEKGLMQIKPPLMSFTKCVHPLVQIVCAESVKQGKQKAPTRLTMAAADFVTVFTKSLVSDSHPTSTQKAKGNTVDKEEKPLIIPVSLSTTGNNNGRKRITLIDNNDAETSTSGQKPQPDLKAEGARALWDNLDDMILLVSELQEWNESSRPLHARGLQQVQKQLMSLARFQDTSHSQGGTVLLCS